MVEEIISFLKGNEKIVEDKIMSKIKYYSDNLNYEEANDLYNELKAYDIIVKCNTVLNKKKVPKADRFAVINAEVLEELNLDARFTANYTILENGIIEGGDINGTKLIFSEELNEGNYAIVALHKSAIGYGKQLEETEAMRLQNSFADGVRGLQVDGVKTLRPDAIVKCVQG